MRFGPPFARMCVFIGYASYATTDLFTVSCTGWVNCLNVDNDRLIYGYRQSGLYRHHNTQLYPGTSGFVDDVRCSVMGPMVALRQQPGCDIVDNDRLIYTYYVSYKDELADNPLYSERNSTHTATDSPRETSARLTVWCIFKLTYRG